MDNPSETPVPPPPSVPTSSPTPPPPPPLPPPPVPAPAVRKKSPLKIILVILLVIGLGIGAAFAVTKLLPSLTGIGSTNLTYWGLWESPEIINPLIEEFQNTHSGAKITYIQQSSKEYRERLQTALSQGKGPDIFRIHNTWVPMLRTELSSLPANIYSASEYDTIFYPAAKSSLRLGTSYVAIPLHYDGLAMYVNDSLLQQAGLSVPKTWDDLRDVSQAITRCDSETGLCPDGGKVLVSGVAMGTSDNVDHWQEIIQALMLQNNVQLNSPAGKSAEDALGFYSIFSRVDKAWNSTLPRSTFQFASGKLGIYFAPSWRIFEILAQNPSLKFSIHPLPQLPTDPTRGERPQVVATFWAEAVNKKSPNTKLAWEFLKFLSTKESLQKLYQNEVAAGRPFGEIYPRTDMAELLTDSPYTKAFIQDAPIATSWYLASDTWDGPTGLNSRLSAYFADAINSASQGRSLTESVKTLAAGITQTLSSYGLIGIFAQ